MDPYIKISIKVKDTSQKEILIAFLSEAGFDAFEEKPNSLEAFIPLKDYDEYALTAILANFKLSFEAITIQPQNWNEEWLPLIL
jgi:ribosomal protein L11 methyltransferase